MSIIRIGPDNIENFTLVTHPTREYTSSSLAGVTGSVSLFARASTIEKEVQPLSAFSESKYNDADLETLLLDIQRAAESSTNIHNRMQGYLNAVNSQAASARKQKTLDVLRFEPSFRLTSDSVRKNLVRDHLMPYYRTRYPTAHYSYTNYHTLNFLTASGYPENSVLIYPNSASAASTTAASGAYTPTGPFTFQFYINPRYTTDDPRFVSTAGSEFKAGTILHLSSTFAVSLVSGSSRDINDKTDGYRIMLQLSHSADVRPSDVDLTVANGQRSYPQDLIFLSDDNALRKDNWHHVAVRWGTQTVNMGSGSFLIDSEPQGTFYVPSSSIAPAPYGPGQGNPDVLCVGNFYEGPNSSTSAQTYFFNQNIATKDGLPQLINDGDATTRTPVTFDFAHPLNAEVHEIKIYDEYRTIEQVLTSSLQGSTSTGSLLFYLPPFFVKESPFRSAISDGAGGLEGGIMQTPFFPISGTTEDPFNVALSFGVGGRDISLENFTREFVQGIYPLLLNLTGSVINVTTEARSANEFLYLTGSVRKRNVTVLPCDNGLFVPDFGMLASGSLSSSPLSGSLLDRFKNDLGSLDFSTITLRDMVPSGTIFNGIDFESGDTLLGISASLGGPSPEDPAVQPGSVLTVLQRTRDNSSNEVVFFDISNMFYGNAINPGSLRLTDSSITGTAGAISMTLRDDAKGNVYRADSKTPHATWNSVGNIFYNEGVVIIKSPNIPFFGKEQFDMSFKGTQNIHTMRIHVPASAGEINSSSNPSFMPLSASDLAHETSEQFVYLTGLQLHDANLNVIMKTKFAQPFIKRDADRMLFRVKMDF